MSFRFPENCKRYEWVSIDLQNPIKIPANGANQVKTGYKFTVDTTHDATPMDWYNAFFEVDLKITKMDNTDYAAADNVGIINGGFSIIDQITVDFDGVKVLDAHKVNHAINVKNLTEFSKDYSDKVGPSMFHYPDTAAGGAVSQKYTTLQLNGNAQNVIPTDYATYNEGFTKRKTLLTGSAANNIHLPLNRFGYFQSFKDQISPNGKVSFEVRLESDDNVIFRANAANAGRYIITKFVLWVPKMVLTPSGQKMFVEKYLKPHTWAYLNERIESSPVSRQRTGKFRITNAIRKPRHVFVWVLNTAKLGDQEQNMFVFNTYNIADNKTITRAQLELANGVFYPERVMDPTNEIGKAYRDLIEYTKGFNDHLSGPTIDLKSFQNLYGILYFDLTHQEEELKEGDTKLELSYQLNGGPDADYSIYALILNEEEISVNVKSGKAVLRT